MREFDDIWPKLIEYAEDQEYVSTFGQGNKNEVRYDREAEAICFNSLATEDGYWTNIRRSAWRAAWENLYETGELTPRQFFGLTNIRRGSTAVPFLQEALELPVDRNERVIHPL